MMKEEFIPYEEALALKELGFDEPCFGRYYYKELYPMLNPQSEETELVFEFGQYIKQTEVTILTPLYQQAFRWFREKGYNNGIVPYYDYYYYHIKDFNNDKEYDTRTPVEATYEEAELACLKKLIEIVQK